MQLMNQLRWRFMLSTCHGLDKLNTYIYIYMHLKEYIFTYTYHISDIYTYILYIYHIYMYILYDIIIYILYPYTPKEKHQPSEELQS